MKTQISTKTEINQQPTVTIMKTKLTLKFAAALLALSTIIYQPSTVFAQGTAFTYQGRLGDGGAPANGNYDILFSLYDAASGGNQVDGTLMGTAVPVTNGLFTVTLDFGNQFPGAGRWLKLDVRTNGVGPYTPLSPRQALTATPYAITAGNLTGNLPAGQVSGTLALSQLPGAVVTNNAGGVNLTGNFSGNGASISNVNAVTLGGLGAGSFWKTGGNSGTTAGASFLGTTDNQPLELKVNGQRALRLEPNTNGAPNVIGGSPVNFVASGFVGAFIGGGGATNYFGFAYTNSIAANFGVIGGGYANQIQANARDATISGGEANSTSGSESTIGGGANNLILPGASGSTIGGGYDNQIQDAVSESTIGGGYDNQILDGAYYSTIGGGAVNQVYGIGSFIGGGGYDGVNYLGNVNGGNASVIGGGVGNQIYADYSAIGGGDGNGIQPYADYSTIGGGDANGIQPYAQFSTIGGGEGNYINAYNLCSTIGGGVFNQIQAGSIDSNSRNSTIGGGFENQIQADSWDSTIAGGGNNTIQTNASSSTIAGGGANTIQANAFGSTIGGGGGNLIQTNAGDSTIGGGEINTIQTGAHDSTIGGGSNNLIQANAVYSTIAGGVGNIAGGSYSFAAGRNAQATNNGAFVWSDGTGTTTSSTATNQFVARASGGFVFYSGTGSGGAQLAAGATAWSVLSDRNAKKNFAPVNGESILDKLAQVPVERWNYKWEKDSGAPNIGPMAQDFKAAFYPGRDDKSITTLEFDGVELAAIQGLNQKVDEQRSQLDQKETEITELKQRLEKLEQLVNAKNGEAK